MSARSNDKARTLIRRQDAHAAAAFFTMGASEISGIAGPNSHSFPTLAHRRQAPTLEECGSHLAFTRWHATHAMDVRFLCRTTFCDIARAPRHPSGS